MSEQFRMRTETDKVYLVCVRVKPYQQKVTFNMAFHVSRIVAGKNMRIIFRWDWSFRLEHIKDCHKFFILLGLLRKRL